MWRLSCRNAGFPNALLPENFSDDDIIAGCKDGTSMCFIQVKACHPDRASTFILRETHEKWVGAPKNHFVVFVWLGSPRKNESPRCWIAPKRAVGKARRAHPAHGTSNWERRFSLEGRPRGSLRRQWQNNWAVFDPYRPQRVP